MAKTPTAEPTRKLAQGFRLPFTVPPKAGEMEQVSLHYARERLRWLQQFDLTMIRSELSKGSLARFLLKGPRGGEHAANHYYRVLRDSRGPDQADKEALEIVAPPAQNDAPDQIASSLVEDTRDKLEKFLASPEGKPFAE